MSKKKETPKQVGQFKKTKTNNQWINPSLQKDPLKQERRDGPGGN